MHIQVTDFTEIGLFFCNKQGIKTTACNIQETTFYKLGQMAKEIKKRQFDKCLRMPIEMYFHH